MFAPAITSKVIITFKTGVTTSDCLERSLPGKTTQPGTCFNYVNPFQEKLYAEIKAVTSDDDRWITDEDLKMMPYLDMVFKEVLRLFPIGAMLQRSVSEDIRISRYL